MRALLVGCGDHGGGTLLPALYVAGIRPVALVDTNLGWARALADQWGVAAAYASIDDVPAGGAEAAIIALPIPEHADHIRRALSRGLHVFVEKTPAVDPAQLDDLVTQAAAHGLVCCVGMNFRCAEGVQLLRYQLASGRYGTARYVRVTQTARKPVTPLDPSMSLEASLFHAQGVHSIDLALLLAPAATHFSGQSMHVDRGRLCAIVGVDPVTRSRAEAMFGSSVAGLFHQVEVVTDAGDLLSLRNLSELAHLPNGGSSDLDNYPGQRVLWCRSPVEVGYATAGYSTELAAFRELVNGAPRPHLAPVATLDELVPVYHAFDQLLTAQGLKWTA